MFYGGIGAEEEDFPAPGQVCIGSWKVSTFRTVFAKHELVYSKYRVDPGSNGIVYFGFVENLLLKSLRRRVFPVSDILNNIIGVWDFCSQ